MPHHPPDSAFKTNGLKPELQPHPQRVQIGRMLGCNVPPDDPLGEPPMSASRPALNPAGDERGEQGGLLWTRVEVACLGNVTR